MTVISTGWKHKGGTSTRKCKCKTWKNHWINTSSKEWPEKCSVSGCDNKAEVGVHIYNPNESFEWIIPTCKSCNGDTDDVFDLKEDTTLISANKQKTCENES